MKKISILLLLFRVCSPAIGQQQTITITPPSVYVPTGSATGNLDFNPLYNSIKGLSDTCKTTTSQIAGISNQLSKTQLEVAQLQASGSVSGSYTPKQVKKISTNTYTVTQADILQTIEFTGVNGCTVYFSGLTNGFECYFIRASGDVKFSGAKSASNRYRLQSLYSNGKAKYDGTNVFLSGELRQ